MAYRFNNIAGTCFTLGADHGSAFTDPAEGLSKVTAAADKGYFEVSLVDMEPVIGRGKHFTLINKVHVQRFKDLRFNKVTDPAFCHDRDTYRFLNFYNNIGVRHSCDTACNPYVCRNPFKCHYGGRSRIFGYPGMVRRNNIHDYTAFKHFGQAYFCFPCGFLSVGPFFICHLW